MKFLEAQSTVTENLEAIKLNLTACVEEGMLDTDDYFYNEILLLIDQADIAKTWDELEEVITKAKILEVDVAAFLAGKGRTTLSLPWPKQP
jgi:hypothetical protein